MMDPANWIVQADKTDEEVSNDAIQLLSVATFNGLCHVIQALGEQGFLSVERLDALHDAMSSPLDDESCRDDDFLVSVRQGLEDVLARVMGLARHGLRTEK